MQFSQKSIPQSLHAATLSALLSWRPQLPQVNPSQPARAVRTSSPELSRTPDTSVAAGEGCADVFA